MNLLAVLWPLQVRHKPLPSSQWWTISHIWTPQWITPTRRSVVGVATFMYSAVCSVVAVVAHDERGEPAVRLKNFHSDLSCHKAGNCPPSLCIIDRCSSRYNAWRLRSAIPSVWTPRSIQFEYEV